MLSSTFIWSFCGKPEPKLATADTPKEGCAEAVVDAAPAELNENTDPVDEPKIEVKPPEAGADIPNVNPAEGELDPKAVLRDADDDWEVKPNIPAAEVAKEELLPALEEPALAEKVNPELELKGLALEAAAPNGEVPKPNDGEPVIPKDGVEENELSWPVLCERFEIPLAEEVPWTPKIGLAAAPKLLVFWELVLDNVKLESLDWAEAPKPNIPFPVLENGKEDDKGEWLPNVVEGTADEIGADELLPEFENKDGPACAAVPLIVLVNRDDAARVPALENADDVVKVAALMFALENGDDVKEVDEPLLPVELLLSVFAADAWKVLVKLNVGVLLASSVEIEEEALVVVPDPNLNTGVLTASSVVEAEEKELIDVPDPNLNAAPVENTAAVDENDDTLLELLGAELLEDKFKPDWPPEFGIPEPNIAGGLGFKEPLFKLGTEAPKAKIDAGEEVGKSDEAELPNDLKDSLNFWFLSPLSKFMPSAWVDGLVFLQRNQKAKVRSLWTTTHKKTLIKKPNFVKQCQYTLNLIYFPMNLLQ